MSVSVTDPDFAADESAADAVPDDALHPTISVAIAIATTAIAHRPRNIDGFENTRRDGFIYGSIR